MAAPSDTGQKRALRGGVMEWLVDRCDPRAIGALVRDVAAFARRHGDETGERAGADIEEMVRTAIERACSCAGLHTRVELDWSSTSPVLTVMPPADAGADLPHDDGCQGRVTVTLPVKRLHARTFSLGLPRPDGLPAAEEFGPEGWLDREAFLKALLVQLSQVVERDQGPEVLDAAITQVGGNVGYRMENEFRRRRGIVERLTPAQMGELFVGLKAGIGGDFYVVEANAEQIVLGNRTCPFGEAVRHSPDLCRMTSSVFGGIAARNAGHSAVCLDQRIAVGDPECRIRVLLAPDVGTPPHAHHYGAPREPLRIATVTSPLMNDLFAETLPHNDVEVVASFTEPAQVLDLESMRVQLKESDAALLLVHLAQQETDTAVDIALGARAALTDLPVVVLCDRPDHASAQRLMDAGTSVGHFSKDDTADAVAFGASLRAVATGNVLFSADIVKALSSGHHDRLSELTPRELLTLSLVAEGLTNQAIADELVVTKRAVEKHLGNVFRKLGLHDDTRDRRVEATLIYQRHERGGQPAES